MNSLEGVQEHHPPIALTIAGSDSGGGAGIQADLKTFALHRVHGTTALTCVTAQNTLGVNRVDALPPDCVTAQIQAVVEDFGVDAIKTGMLFNVEIVETVAQTLKALPQKPFVVDPVMVSRAGAKLLSETAIAAIKTQLLPLATIVTPNRYEAEILCGQSITTLKEMEAAARHIFQLGSQAVLVKGGSLTGIEQGTDIWFDGDRLERLTVAPIPTRHTHGTGCTLSAAITARLASGDSPWQAVQEAKAFVTSALKNSLAIGQGQGSVGHIFVDVLSNQ
jgi:hydroxymethylpyrimidine/phosphomethylpyrimidine kinase